MGKENSSNVVGIRINNLDTDWLAKTYVAAFAEPPWNETHKLSEVIQKFEMWLNNPNYSVRVFESSGESIGFVVTRKVPLEGIVENIVAELESVSGVVLGKDQVDAMRSEIERVTESGDYDKTSIKDKHPALVGVFQDIVIIPSARGKGNYNLMILPMTVELLLDGDVKMLMVYSKTAVGTIVNTLKLFGGTKILEIDKVVVYAASSDTVKKRLQALNLWTRDKTTNNS